MVCPSTITSPVLPISVSNVAFSRKPPHQYTGAAINETFNQPLVQRIRQFILYCTRESPANVPDPPASRDDLPQMSRF